MGVHWCVRELRRMLYVRYGLFSLMPFDDGNDDACLSSFIGDSGDREVAVAMAVMMRMLMLPT